MNSIRRPAIRDITHLDWNNALIMHHCIHDAHCLSRECQSTHDWLGWNLKMKGFKGKLYKWYYGIVDWKRGTGKTVFRCMSKSCKAGVESAVGI